MGYKYDQADSGAEFNDFQYFKEMFETDFTEYLDGSEFSVETADHGWRNQSGTFTKTYDTGEEFLMDILENHSEFSLEVEFEDGFCKVVLYSHDNPTGAIFKLREQQ